MQDTPFVQELIKPSVIISHFEGVGGGCGIEN